MTVSFDALKESAAETFGIPISDIKFLRYSQNAVYEITPPDSSEAHILRITSDSHRSENEILAELEWIHFLHEQQLPVCRAIPWRHNELIKTLIIGHESFHAVLFQKAPGQAPVFHQLSPRLYHAHGALLGKLHASNSRAPASTLRQRKAWHQERYFTTDIDTCIPEDQRLPLRQIIESDVIIINSWSKTTDTFGPIHADLGYSNFHVHDKEITVFDFDNCTLGPFAMDIAAALYGSIFTGIRRQTPGDRSVFEHPQTSRHLEAVWQPFKEGYQAFHPWPHEWNAQVGVCFRVLYFRAVLHAVRILKFSENPDQHPALQTDIENLLIQRMPLDFDFVTGRASA